jgi:hypothetical protein
MSCDCLSIHSCCDVRENAQDGVTYLCCQNQNCKSFADSNKRLFDKDEMVTVGEDMQGSMEVG